MSSQMWLSQAEMWSYISPNPPRGSTRWGGCLYVYVCPLSEFHFSRKTPDIPDIRKWLTYAI